MSNRRVREEIEAKIAYERVYDKYHEKESVITNYQICKAFFHDQSLSIIGVVEKVLKEKYNLPWQLKFIRKALMDARGQRNATISIPQFKFEETTHTILSKFVKKNFAIILADQRVNREYPFMLRDIIEKYS